MVMRRVNMPGAWKQPACTASVAVSPEAGPKAHAGSREPLKGLEMQKVEKGVEGAAVAGAKRSAKATSKPDGADEGSGGRNGQKGGSESGGDGE